MENSLKECLPPKMRGFIIKRQAKLTPDQAKHFHCDMPARRLEADRMVEAFNRFDQTDALLEQVLCDRVKLEQRSNRVHAHTSYFVQQQPSSSATSEEVEPIDYPIQSAGTESESELDWDPECVDDDGYSLVDESGSTMVPVPRDGPLDEPEPSSLSVWAQGYQESRNNLRDSIIGRGYCKPALSRCRMKVRKTLFAKKQPRRDRNVRTPFRDKNERTWYRAYHRS